MSKEKAAINLSRLLGDQTLQYWRPLLDRIERMSGSGSLFKHIADCWDTEQIEDHLAAVRYSVVFAALNFEVAIEPCGRTGPDLLIKRDGNEAFVEITRFRKRYEGPLPLKDNEEPELLAYGNLERDIQKSWSKIVSKFRQVSDRESIIAIWNDEGDLEDIEVAEAVEKLRKGAKEGAIPIPSGAAFVVYGSSWIGAGPNPLGKEFYCFRLKEFLKAHHRQWLGEIEDSILAELIARAVVKKSK